MDTEVTFRSEQRMTQREFYAWVHKRPGNDIHRYELIHGRIVMTPPAKFPHAEAESLLNHRIRDHVERCDLGVVLGSSAGYELPSGDTLEPDLAFIARERFDRATADPRGGFCRIVPDLVVEILSRSTAQRDRTEKMEIYAANGVREYWLVDPQRHTVRVHRLGGTSFDDGVEVETGPVISGVLPDLALTVEDVFRRSGRR